ncbi:MAG: type II toxin-antitoxin system VapC family toxin [Oscillospiraceae bacterium]|nr:type II toxin-antitoxin system VapC family toxin [Oscillospiraceae bacterium]
MNILIDTHIAVWALNDEPMLSPSARDMILDETNTIYYSIISVWEILLKHQKRPGSFPFDETEFSEFCKRSGFVLLSLTEDHLFTVRSLSRDPNIRPHNDPFDKILLAQAKTEGMLFMTHDSLISGYDETCIISV